MGRRDETERKGSSPSFRPVALAQARDRRQDVGDPRELGRKIMEKRNLNYQK